VVAVSWARGPPHIEPPLSVSPNKVLTKVDLDGIGHSGARVLALWPALKTWACTMALDPEELVTLTNHGNMKLRAAVARAMILLPQERDLATIVREGEPTILDFGLIKLLAAQWEEQGLFLPSE
jgi:hypothetical protein